MFISHGRLSLQLNFVSKNKAYLTEALLPVAAVHFETYSGSSSDVLRELHQSHSRGPPKPKPRSIYQTDVI